MNIGICGDKAAMVFSDEEMQELDDKRDGSGLIVTDHLDNKFIFAIIDTEAAYANVKKQSVDRGIPLVYMNRCQIDDLKDGMVYDCSAQLGYNLYICLEQGLKTLGYERAKNTIVNHDMSSTKTLQ